MKDKLKRREGGSCSLCASRFEPVYATFSMRHFLRDIFYATFSMRHFYATFSMRHFYATFSMRHFLHDIFYATFSTRHFLGESFCPTFFTRPFLRDPFYATLSTRLSYAKLLSVPCVILFTSIQGQHPTMYVLVSTMDR